MLVCLLPYWVAVVAAPTVQLEPSTAMWDVQGLHCDMLSA